MAPSRKPLLPALTLLLQLTVVLAQDATATPTPTPLVLVTPTAPPPTTTSAPTTTPGGPVPVQSPCPHVQLPKNLCSSCPLKEFDERGMFEIQKEIHDIDHGPCRRQIERYVRLNPCDTVRARQVADWDDPENHAAIGVFMYSICETCCDCVPHGSKQGQYRRRRRRNTLINVSRGNCPAHLTYDVCRIWFWIRTVTVEGVAGNLDWERVCLPVRSWIRSPESDGWLERANVDLDPIITRFLTQFTEAAGCSRRKVWRPCVALERAQGRV